MAISSQVLWCCCSCFGAKRVISKIRIVSGKKLHHEWLATDGSAPPFCFLSRLLPSSSSSSSLQLLLPIQIYPLTPLFLPLSLDSSRPFDVRPLMAVSAAKIVRCAGLKIFRLLRSFFLSLSLICTHHSLSVCSSHFPYDNIASFSFFFHCYHHVIVIKP